MTKKMIRMSKRKSTKLLRRKLKRSRMLMKRSK